MKGGARPGAGRKKNEESLKYKFQHYWSEDEIKALVAELKAQYKSKPELLKFIAEQIFGKAPQRVEMTGEDGKQLTIKIINFDNYEPK